MSYSFQHLFVEGFDGTGKSSCIKYTLEKHPEFIHHHFSLPLGDGNDEKFGFQRGQFSMFFTMLEKMPMNIRFMLDRSHIGEWVWSPLFRGKEPLYLESLEKYYSNLNILVINFVCDPVEIIKRIEKRNIDGKQIEKVPDIRYIEETQRRMIEACERSIFPLKTIDTTNLTIEQACKQFEKTVVT